MKGKLFDFPGYTLRHALSALQTAAVPPGLPFSVVLAFMCRGLVRQLRRDRIPPPPGIDHGER